MNIILHKIIFLYLLIFICFPKISYAQSQWRETQRDNGCIYYEGTVQDDVIPVRAVCEWDIPPASIHKSIALISSHDLIFSRLTKSDSISQHNDNKTPTETGLILQVHSFPGVTDRAAIMEYSEQELPNGKRYLFVKSKNQKALPSRYVEIEVNKGYWEVVQTKSGSKITFETSYAPGGYLPSFLIQWFQVSGTKQVMDELLMYVKKHL